jgi:hypothetical protein
MDIRPVSRIAAPAYPTREELPAERVALGETLPVRWRKARGLVSALTLFMAANMTGCGGESGRPAGNSIRIDTTGRILSSDDTVAEADGWIRSIFRKPQPVMLGCIAVMPPAVLQEDAAVKATQDAGQTP